METTNAWACRWPRQRCVFNLSTGRVEPVPGSRPVDYDPFADDGRETLVEALLALDAASQDDGSLLGIDRFHEAVEDFSSRWGLLGLKEHHVVKLDADGAAWIELPQSVGKQETTEVGRLYRDERGKWAAALADGEPVWLFTAAVAEFRRCVDLAARPGNSELRAILNRHLRRAHPVLAGRDKLEWRCPTLLTAAYLQLAHQIDGAARPQTCARPNCQATFPFRSNRRYCSDRCRAAAAMARGRAAQRAKQGVA